MLIHVLGHILGKKAVTGYWKIVYRHCFESLTRVWWDIARAKREKEQQFSLLMQLNSLCLWLRAYKHAERTSCVHTTALKSVRWLVLHILVDFCWQKNRGLWAQAQGREVYHSTLADCFCVFLSHYLLLLVKQVVSHTVNRTFIVTLLNTILDLWVYIIIRVIITVWPWMQFASWTFILVFMKDNVMCL